MRSERNHDPQLETLLLPFTTGKLSWPEEGAMFMRARVGASLQKNTFTNLICEQSFKPDADALTRSGFSFSKVAADEDSDAQPRREYPLVLLLPPRQRDEARAAMARALDLAGSSGRVIACASNNEGARSSENDLAALAGPLSTLVKNKCRVFWTSPTETTNLSLLQEWRTLDAIRPIAAGRFLSRPGVFAWDRIDVASQLLAEHLPNNLRGRAADLGAGFGYLSAELLTRCAVIETLHVYEAENRALQLSRLNLKSFEQRVSLDYRWHDVTLGLPEQYDVIVTNPPFHTQSRVDRPDVGNRFIAVAAAALRPGGQLWLVANRHLAYEAILNESFGSVRCVAQLHGFKIITAQKSFS